MPADDCPLSCLESNSRWSFPIGNLKSLYVTMNSFLSFKECCEKHHHLATVRTISVQYQHLNGCVVISI